MRRLLIITTVLFFALAGVASADEPWWGVTSGAVPSYLPPEGEGELVVSLSNLGDATVDGGGAGGPVLISDVLPAGLKALSVSGAAGIKGEGLDDAQRGEVVCSPVSVVPLTCSYAGTLPPYDPIELVIKVKVLPGAGEAGSELNQVAVSGGGAPPATLSRPVTVSGEPVPFGLQQDALALESEGGGPDTRAGSHPYQATGTVITNQAFQLNLNEKATPAPVALPKDVNVKLPPGLVGNPTPITRCTIGEFLTQTEGTQADACPASSAVGVASVLVYEPDFGVLGFVVPVFDLEPAFGEPARFGFYIGTTQTPVLLDTSLRGGPGTGEEYAITISSLNTPQTVGLLSTSVSFWGVPGDPVHDGARGWGCLKASRGVEHSLPCENVESQHPPAFLTLPTSCSGGPLQSSAVLDSWAEPAAFLSVPASPAPPPLDGCNQLAFAPAVQASPTTDSASSPSGLDVNLDVHDEGLTAASGVAQSQIKQTVVTLPEGLTINPSSGVGLAGCTEADFARESISSGPGEGCPNESQLGTVEAETPLLKQKLEGEIFIAQPYANPFKEPPEHPDGTLVAIYIVIKNPETGILVKLPGKVTPNPVTGQLTTVVENIPQTPISHFEFHFREGTRAPLITPPTCGTYTTTALLTPWSEPLSALEDTSSFQISAGVGAGACPAGGAPPFAPQISAGMLNNNAGAFSEFDLHLTRGDGDSEISSFSTTMPPGFTGVLTGIPYCPEAAIALARTKTGRQEETEPSCPPASQIGHTLVGTGAGTTLAYTPGRIYLAGPYDGDPFSLVSVTSAVVGPFDLGTVVIRFGLRIDPVTAQVSVDPTASEPIPTIIRGIVTHVRDIRAYIDRPSFTLNPTSCEHLAVQSTLTSNLGQSATIASPFQDASCQNLKYQPTLNVTTAAKASKVNGASLHFLISYPKNAIGSQSWMREMKFEIPRQLPARLTTIQKACLAATFEHDRSACPPASIIGHLIVHTPVLPVPLEGPLYFVSYGGAAFPDAVAVIHGDGVTIESHGHTFIDGKTGVTSATFDAVPDVPFESIDVTVPQGPFSEFGANLPHGSLSFCGQKLVMPILFKAQNGAEIKRNVPVGVTGCPKSLTNKQKLAAALKACKKKHGKKRAACEKAARKKYGAKASAKKARR